MGGGVVIKDIIVVSLPFHVKYEHPLLFCICFLSHLRRPLQPPLCLPSSLTVLEVAKRMADVRTDAAILLDSHGHLEGIITDNDVAR